MVEWWWSGGRGHGYSCVFVLSFLVQECYTNDKSTHFVCSTKREVDANEQLTSKYGSRTGGRGNYALNYGFIDESWMVLNEPVVVEVVGGGGGSGSEGGESGEGGGVGGGERVEGDGGPGPPTKVIVRGAQSIDALVEKAGYSWGAIKQGLVQGRNRLTKRSGGVDARRGMVSTTDVLVGARIHREEEEEEVEGIAEQQRKHELGEQIRHAEIETIARALDHTNTRLKSL